MNTSFCWPSRHTRPMACGRRAGGRRVGTHGRCRRAAAGAGRLPTEGCLDSPRPAVRPAAGSEKPESAQATRACRSSAGFQEGSSSTSRLAPTMFSPHPPACAAAHGVRGGAGRMDGAGRRWQDARVAAVHARALLALGQPPAGAAEPRASRRASQPPGPGPCPAPARALELSSRTKEGWAGALNWSTRPCRGDG